MTMSDKDSAYTVNIVFKIFCVWKDIINTWRITLRHKLESNIKDEDVTICFDREHVASHFLHSTEWYDTDYVFRWCVWEVIYFFFGKSRGVTHWSTQRSTCSAFFSWTTRSGTRLWSPWSYGFSARFCFRVSLWTRSWSWSWCWGHNIFNLDK